MAATSRRFGVIGVSGYAAFLIEALDRWVERDRAVIAAVDVSMSEPTDAIAAILGRHRADRVMGVDALMAREDLDVMVIATSIDSHLPYARQALARGLHVHCEKPVTATIQDAHAMIRARDEAKRFVAVGFHDTYSPSTQWAKRLILDGAIGTVRQAKVWAAWPRGDSYYARNDWAGLVKRHGAWVLDSPAANALAHQLNLLLYLTGPAPHESNTATEVAAELYRARPTIENYDTFAVRAATQAGPQLLILLTHACATSAGPVLEIVGETGTIRRPNMHCAQLVRDGQVVEEVPDGDGGTHGSMFRSLLDRIDGKTDRIHCEIENAMEVTRLYNAASQCRPIEPIDEQYRAERNIRRGANADVGHTVEGIEAVLEACFDRFELPYESGLAPWATPPASMSMIGYDQFTGLAESSQAVS